MTRTLTTIALAGLLVGVAAAPASAKKAQFYSGKTFGGQTMTFKKQGNRIFAIDGMVPVTCASPGSAVTRAGGEPFNPPGSFRIGTARKVSAVQQPGFGHQEVTKYYRVTLKKRRNGHFVGKLHVNYGFGMLGVDTWGNWGLDHFICQGDDGFSA